MEPTIGLREPLQPLRNALSVVFRRRKIVLFIALLVGIYCVIEHRFVSPLYQTTIKLRVESSPPPVAGFDQNLSAGFDPTFLHRQCSIVRSPAVVRDVVRDMKLSQLWGLSEEAAVNRLARRISARPTREQDLLTVDVEANDLLQAVAIGDALVAAYEQQLIESARRPAFQLLESLRAQADEQTQRLQSARAQVRQYKQTLRNDSADAPSGEEALSRLADRLGAMRSELADLDSRAETLARLAQGRDLTAAAQLAGDAQSAALVNSLASTDLELAAMRADYGPDHPALQKRMRARDELVKQLQGRLASAAHAMKLEIDARRARLADLQSQFAASGTYAGEPNAQAFRDAQQDQQLQASLYEETRGRIQRVSLGMQLWSSPVQIIARSGRANLVAYARLSDMPAIAIGLVLILGCGAALFVERWRGRISCAEDASELLGLPVIARLCGTMRLLGEHERQSPELESYRMLLNQLDFAAGDDGVQSVAIVSARRGEGRTLTAANLAALYAARGRRVLLVEADFSRPMLRALLGAEPGPGFLDFIDAAAPIAQTIAPTDLDNIWLAAAGHRSESATPTLIQLNRFATAVRDQFDVIVYDTAPLLESSDAALIARQAGLAIFLVKADAYPRRDAIRAADLLLQSGCKCVGVAFNETIARAGLRMTETSDAPLQFRIARRRAAQQRVQLGTLRGAA